MRTRETWVAVQAPPCAVRMPRRSSSIAAAQNRWRAVAFALSVQHEIELARHAGAETTQEIADLLNSRGVPARKGGLWYRASVQRVLRRADLHRSLTVPSVVPDPVPEPLTE